MDLTYSGYALSTGEKLFYSILKNGDKDNGYDIYLEGASHPYIHQPEPFIPYPSLTYAENAIKMCEEMASVPNSTEAKTIPERLTDIEANIDYLMLLNDSDSLSYSE